jgi:two-component system response regulator PhoP
MRILVIEDEAALRETLARRLTDAGYSVDTAAEGEEGLYAATERPLDAAIVDLGLPKLSGIELIRELRNRQSTLPVLVLTVRKHWADTVQALEVGADDYMHKPFHFQELVARIQVLMRRRSGWAASELICEPIVLNLASRTVRMAGVPVELTSFEYSVLEYLMLHAGQIVTKGELRERLYDGDGDHEGNVLDVVVSRLRKKLDPDDRIEPIQTVRGVGYRAARRASRA